MGWQIILQILYRSKPKMKKETIGQFKAAVLTILVGMIILTPVSIIFKDIPTWVLCIIGFCLGFIGMIYFSKKLK